MREQTELAIEDGDVILFMMDAREGVTSLDEIFAERLRHQHKPVILLANKSESRESGGGVGEAYSLGFGEPVAISAEHGEGMADLYAAIGRRQRRHLHRRGRRARQADPHRHHRPPERRQVDPGQPPDRRGPAADRARGRHHPRFHLGRLGIRRPEHPPGRHRRHAPQGAGAGEAGEAVGRRHHPRHHLRRGGRPGDGQGQRLRHPGPAARRPGRARGPGAGLCRRQMGPGGGPAGARWPS